MERIRIGTTNIVRIDDGAIEFVIAGRHGDWRYRIYNHDPRIMMAEGYAERFRDAVYGAKTMVATLDHIALADFSQRHADDCVRLAEQGICP